MPELRQLWIQHPTVGHTSLDEKEREEWFQNATLFQCFSNDAQTLHSYGVCSSANCTEIMKSATAEGRDPSLDRSIKTTVLQFTEEYTNLVGELNDKYFVSKESKSKGYQELDINISAHWRELKMDPDPAAPGLKVCQTFVTLWWLVCLGEGEEVFQQIGDKEGVSRIAAVANTMARSKIAGNNTGLLDRITGDPFNPQPQGQPQDQPQAFNGQFNQQGYNQQQPFYNGPAFNGGFNQQQQPFYNGGFNQQPQPQQAFSNGGYQQQPQQNQFNQHQQGYFQHQQPVQQQPGGLQLQQMLQKQGGFQIPPQQQQQQGGYQMQPPQQPPQQQQVNLTKRPPAGLKKPQPQQDEQQHKGQSPVAPPMPVTSVGLV
jgi:hypothetical protein